MECRWNISTFVPKYLQCRFGIKTRLINPSKVIVRRSLFDQKLCSLRCERMRQTTHPLGCASTLSNSIGGLHHFSFDLRNSIAKPLTSAVWEFRAIQCAAAMLILWDIRCRSSAAAADKFSSVIRLSLWKIHRVAQTQRRTNETAAAAVKTRRPDGAYAAGFISRCSSYVGHKWLTPLIERLTRAFLSMIDLRDRSLTATWHHDTPVLQ